jgi:NADPH:quinone reductase-like Zn-dependent oxidoreductase
MAEDLLNQLDKVDLTDKTNRLALTAFAVYGAWYLTKCAWYGFSSVSKYMLLPRRNHKTRYGGGWAVVTGSSDGIGKQYATELAKSGLNIVLVARNQEKTQAVAKEISELYKVETKVVVYDFAKLSTEESVHELEQHLKKELDGLDISILVNNVGTASFGSFHEFTWE